MSQNHVLHHSQSQKESKRKTRSGSSLILIGEEKIRVCINAFHPFGKQRGSQNISNAYLATQEGQASENRESWEAYQEYILLAVGKGGTLTKLDKLAKAHPANSEVQKYRARGYQEYGEHEKAAHYFETAAQQAGSEKHRLARYGDAALAFTRTGQRMETKRIVDTMKTVVPQVEDGEVQLIKTLRNIAELETTKDVLFGVTEKLLDLCPDDIDVRFSLAHQYSEQGEEALSLFHYLKIPYQERSAATWNNLGVQFGRFDLDSKSVEAYRKAEELGETLAMSNLAQKLLQVGFLEEAHEICNRAIKIKNYHKNVNYAIARIKDLPETEEKKEGEIIRKATSLCEFYKHYGHAFAATEPGDHVGKWQGPDCELSVTIIGNVFLAEGTFERAFPSALFLLQIPPLGVSTQVDRYFVRYEGTITGHTVNAIFTQKKEGESTKPSSLLTSKEEEIKVLMILSESLREIRAYQKCATEDHKLFTLRRLH